MSDPANKKPAQQLDEALERAKIDNELIESLNEWFKIIWRISKKIK